MRSEVTVVVAMNHNRTIGLEGRIPWSSSEDLQRFKALTLGSPVIMGRRTWESLPRRPLPGRVNVVVSRTMPAGPLIDRDDPSTPATWIVPSLIEGIRASGMHPRIFIIGGAELVLTALREYMVDRIELTIVDDNTEGDVKMPAFEHSFRVTTESSVPASATTPALRYITYEHVPTGAIGFDFKETFR